MRIIDHAGRLAALAAIVVAAAALPATASAQTLVGERLESAAHVEAFTYDGICDPDGPSTFSYASFGSADGPVPGQYTQYGSVTLASPDGPVIAYSAEFAIDSPSTYVTGTKSLAEQGTGSCVPGDAATFVAEVPAAYEVDSPFVETGPALVRLSGTYASGTLAATFGPPAPAGPTSKQDCMDGRWADYGFRNQGQCIKAVDDKSGRP